MKKIIITVLPFTLFIGIFCIIFSQIDGNLTILHQTTITYGNGASWTFYKFDSHQYLLNLQNSTDIYQLRNILPTKPVFPASPQSNWTILEYFNWFVNIEFVYVTNWVIFVLNLALLVPIKATIIYPLHITFAIIGINTSNDQFIHAIEWLYEAEIPQIPPL